MTPTTGPVSTTRFFFFFAYSQLSHLLYILQTVRHVQLRDNLKILRREGISSTKVLDWYLGKQVPVLLRIEYLLLIMLHNRSSRGILR